jgi:GTP pyrophosphokinase
MRKGTSIPYISHPLAVASIVIEQGGSEDQAIAALLHDAVEDHADEVTFDEIHRRFGPGVAGIVAACSDSDVLPKPPFMERKKAYVARLAAAGSAEALVMLADKIHNARCILRDLRQHGEAVWERFNGGKTGTLWYYRALVDAFRERARGVREDPLAAGIDELDRLVCMIEQRARGSRQSAPFFHAERLGHPEDVRVHLARLSHWRDGFSAAAIARSWIGGSGIPEPVRAVLDRSEVYRDAGLVEAFFEHETWLRTPGRASQTDVLALVATARGYAVLAVEGKRHESFGDRVTEWLRADAETTSAAGASPEAVSGESPTRRRRLEELCTVLGLTGGAIGQLRYQLLHRTVAAVYEAERYRCGHAAVIVHSFSGEQHVGFDDFAAFARAVGAAVTREHPLSTPVVLEGCAVTFAWVKDSPRIEAA